MIAPRVNNKSKKLRFVNNKSIEEKFKTGSKRRHGSYSRGTRYCKDNFKILYIIIKCREIFVVKNNKQERK